LTKGYNKESCYEAIIKCFVDEKPRQFSNILAEVKKLGSWKEQTICLHMMSMVVNLPPARLHWPNRTPVLFLRPDGQYELYDETKCPNILH